MSEDNIDTGIHSPQELLMELLRNVINQHGIVVANGNTPIMVYPNEALPELVKQHIKDEKFAYRIMSRAERRHKPKVHTLKKSLNDLKELENLTAL